MGDRWFIGAATTAYTEESGFEDRSELAAEVERIAVMFSSLGYRRVPGFGVNPSASEFQVRLRQFLVSPDRHADDIVAVYYTGHGHLEHGSLLLPMADTTADVAFTSMPAADLTGRLLSSPVNVQKLLLILDTCYAGAAGAALASGAIDFLGRLRGLAGSPSVGIVVAARPTEQAESGAFTAALSEAVGHRASGGVEPEFLALDGLVSIVNDTTPAWQHARLFLTGDGITEFFPNPRLDRWLRDLDVRTQALHQVREARRVEQRDHVLPRAQGLDTAGQEDLWLFTGRHQALREICRWLLTPTGPAAMVVTGDPGSGKSALLARLFVLADAKLRGRVPRPPTLPEDTLPPPGSIARFIHARGLTADELMAGLCEACDVDETTSPGQLLASVGSSGDPIVVIVDALDEAIAPREARARGQFPVIDQVLAPLARGAHRTRLRLLLGTRRNLLPALGSQAQLVDLDTSAFADPPSVAAYARSCLIHLSEDSPYRGKPRDYLDAVAGAIAAAAGRSFLVTLITARSLALRDTLANPHDRDWRTSLPTAAAAAMRDDLDGRLDEQADRARDLLLPLAYAQGTGLPWEDLWPRLARALTATACTNSDLDWLIETAGYYVVESTSEDGRRSAYRLYHEALAEHLRATRLDTVADQAAIVDALTAHAPRLDDGRTDWAQAHPYTRTNLVTHAVGTDRLDPLLTDPLFLLAAARAPLLAALPSAETPIACASADAYRRADARLRGCPEQDRPACLQLAARCGRAAPLADAISASGLPLTWTTNWASQRLQPPHQTFIGHTDCVTAVATDQLDGRTIIASGSNDGTTRIWDAATGTPLADPLTGHAGSVTAVATGQVDGHIITVSGSNEGTIRIWDAATGTPLASWPTDDDSAVYAVATGQLPGHDIIVSGSINGTIRIWDAATGTPLADPLTGHAGSVYAVATGQVDGRTIIVSGSRDRTVRIWDAATGTELTDPLTGHKDWIRTVAVGYLDGRTIIASGSDDKTVRIWDAATGTELTDPLTGHDSGVNAVAIGQVDGRTMIISGGGDGTIRIWDAAVGTSLLRDPFTGLGGGVNAVATGQVDGRTIIVSGSSNGTIRIWDAATGASLATPLVGHAGSVNAVATGHVNRRTIIVSGGGDGMERIWDAATGTPLVSRRERVKAVATGHLNGRTIIVSGSSNCTIRIWDASTHTPLATPLAVHDSDVNAVATGDLYGRTIIVSGSSNGTIRIWDAVTGTELTNPLTVHDSGVNAVATGYLSGRTIIVSGSINGTIRIWDAATGTPLADPLTGHAGSVNAVATGHLSGRTIIVSGSSDTTVRVWDAATGTPLSDPLTGHTDRVGTVAVGYLDGRSIIVSGSDDGTVRVWDAATTTPLVNPFTGHTSDVNAVATGHLSGHTIIVSGSSDTTVRIWDAATGTLLMAPLAGHGGSVYAVTTGQLDSRTFVASGSSDGTVRLWEAATGAPLMGPLAGHGGSVNAVATGQLGSRTFVASGSSDGTVRLWEAATGAPLMGPLAGHDGSVNAVATGQLGDRTIIVSGSNNGTVRVWDVAAGTEMTGPLVRHGGDVTAVATGQLGDRTIIVSGSNNGTVRVWDAATGTPLSDPLVGHTDWVRTVAVGYLDGRTIIISGGDDQAIRIWDLTTRKSTTDLPWCFEKTESPSSRIDLAASVFGVAYADSGRFVVATELGVVSLRISVVESFLVG